MDQKIIEFIQDLEAHDVPKADIVESLYDLFTEANTLIKERFIYGGIGFYIDDILIGGIYVSSKHVSLVFSKGYQLFDKYNVLLGEGKYRRHIALTDISDIENKACQYYIKQVIALENI